jgi:hypothetical protein
MPIPPVFAAINRVHSHFILMPAQVTHCAYGTCGIWVRTYIAPERKLPIPKKKPPRKPESLLFGGFLMTSFVAFGLVGL